MRGSGRGGRPRHQRSWRRLRPTRHVDASADEARVDRVVRRCRPARNHPGSRTLSAATGWGGTGGEGEHQRGPAHRLTMDRRWWSGQTPARPAWRMGLKLSHQLKLCRAHQAGLEAAETTQPRWHCHAGQSGGTISVVELNLRLRMASAAWPWPIVRAPAPPARGNARLTGHDMVKYLGLTVGLKLLMSGSGKKMLVMDDQTWAAWPNPRRTPIGRH